MPSTSQMELKFPMLTSEGAEDRVETLINSILKAVGDLPVGRRKSPGWLKESLIPLCTNCIQKGYLTFAAEQMERIQAEAQNFREATTALQEREEAAALRIELERTAMKSKLEEASKRQAEGDVRQSKLLEQVQEYKKRIGEAAQIVRAAGLKEVAADMDSSWSVVGTSSPGKPVAPTTNKQMVSEARVVCR